MTISRWLCLALVAVGCIVAQYTPPVNTSLSKYATRKAGSVFAGVAKTPTAAGAGTCCSNGSTTTQSFFQEGNHYRLQQSGWITALTFYYGTPSKTTSLVFKLWRRQAPNSLAWDNVAVTENLVPLVTTPGAVNTFTLTTPIWGQQGDYYGFTQTMTSGPDVIYEYITDAAASAWYVQGSVPGVTGYAWRSQNQLALGVPVTVTMSSGPNIVAIGDSLTAGELANWSYLDTTGGALTPYHPELAYPFYLQQLTGLEIVNAGVGGNQSTDVVNRLSADMINRIPQAGIVMIGTNDLNNGVSEATYLANLTTIFSAMQAAAIKIIYILIPPNLAQSTGNMTKRDTWNTDASVIARSYGATIVDVSQWVGQQRADGPAGNLWGIRDRYNGDNTHYSAAGYRRFAEAVYAALVSTQVAPADYDAPLLTLGARGTTFATSGCSITASTVVGGAYSGQFTSGTTGTCTVTMTMGAYQAAPIGWNCTAFDITTPANLILQTASTTKTATIAGTTASGDIVYVSCTPR